MMPNRWVDRATNLFPYLLLLTAGLGIGMTMLLRRIDLTIFSLILVVPLALAALVLLASKKTNLVAPPALGDRIRFSHLLLTNLLVLIISVILLFSHATRPLTYFIMVSVYSGIVLLQIISPRPRWTDSLILAQISLLSLNLIWGVTLKYPLYFGDTDLLVHLDLTNTILKTGHVQTYYIDYQNYPLYHIFTAIAVEVTGLSLRTSLFVVMGLAWQLGILFAFLLFRRLSQTPRLPLIACLLFATSSQIIFYGSYSIARSLAFVFFMVWLHLVLGKAQNDGRYLVLSFVSLAALIMTHHLNVVYTILIMLMAYACQMLVDRSRRNRLIDLMFIQLLAIGAIAYLAWVASDMSNVAIRETMISLLSMDAGIKSTSAITNEHGVSVVVGTLYYSFVLLLALLGVKIALSHIKLTDHRHVSGTFASIGVSALVLFVPAFPALLPLSDVLLTDRLSLIASPFVVFLMAYGVEYLYHLRRTPLPKQGGLCFLSVSVAAFVAVGTFLSVISIGNAKDTNYFPQSATVESPYFTQSELNSFSFLSGRGDGMLPLYADYPTTRNDYYLSDFETRTILVGGDVNSTESGYLILRKAELQRKSALSFNPPVAQRVVYFTVRYPIDSLNTELAILDNSPTGSRVYSDRDVQLYLMR